MAIDYDDNLAALIAALSQTAEQAASALEAERDGPQFEQQMSRMLVRGSLVAALLGAEEAGLTPETRDIARKHVEAQLSFLRGFVFEVVSAAEFEKGWAARAAMYAESIKTPYWQSRTRMLPLPAMPAQGTQCHTRCGCSWSVEEFADRWEATWVRGKGDSCQTCVQRAAEWAPYVITKTELGEP